MENLNLSYSWLRSARRERVFATLLTDFASIFPRRKGKYRCKAHQMVALCSTWKTNQLDKGCREEAYNAKKVSYLTTGSPIELSKAKWDDMGGCDRPTRGALWGGNQALLDRVTIINARQDALKAISFKAVLSQHGLVAPERAFYIPRDRLDFLVCIQSWRW